MESLYNNVVEAYARISENVVRTPIVEDTKLSEATGATVLLKCENLQHTGSFKFRGAMNTVLCLSNDEKTQGVVTASTGNHGAAITRAGSSVGVVPVVYVPEGCSPTKLSAMKDAGADVVKVTGDAFAAESAARTAAKKANQQYISPYNDERVLAGQGTCGLEILDQCNDVDAVFVAVGGGGLISGIAGYLAKAAPHVEVVGCWPEVAPAMLRCIEAGKVISVCEEETISDGTAGGVEPGTITLEPCRTLIKRKVTVSEDAIKQAMRHAANDLGMRIEGAAGVAIAAFEKVSGDYIGKTVAIVVCGGNIADDKYLSIIS